MGIAKTIAKNTSFNFVATASDIAINFVVGIVLARGLGTGQYGLYSFLFWFLGLTVIVSRLGLGETAKRFIAEGVGQQDKSMQRSLVQWTLITGIVFTLLISLVVFTFSRFWATVFSHPNDQVYFVLLAIMLAPYALNLTMISIFAGFQKYEYGAYLTLSTNPLRAVLITAAMFLNFGVREVFLIHMSTSFLGVLVGLFLLNRIIPLRELVSVKPIESATMKRVIKYALVMTGVMGVNYVLWQQVEVLFLGLYAPLEQVGFYTLASKIPFTSIMLIPSVLGGVLLPAISEQFGKGDTYRLRRIYQTAARYLMMLALPLAAVGIALARPLVQVLYGTDYAPVVGLMQILFIPFAMRGIADAAVSVIYGIEKPSFILKTGVVLVSLNIGLSLWLIPRYGAIGAAIASSAPRLLLMPLYARFASHKIGAAWPLVDTLKIALASLVVGLVLFFMQSYVSPGVALVLAVPVGIGLFFAAAIVLRIVHTQDLQMLQGIKNSLPPAIRRQYAALVLLVGKLVETKPSL
ncbi:MAG: oligosaccharide flippase family protein [Chloroflexi bacterium]|nr:oligosaccharide flippase family protein [Chloroflexota bacterium]